MNAVMLAHQILTMEDELVALRFENARLREVEKQFHEYVAAETLHHERMMANLLDAMLKKEP